MEDELKAPFGRLEPVEPIQSACLTSLVGIFNAMPTGKGLLPTLRAVPNLSSSHDDTFSIVIPSFWSSVQFVGLRKFNQVFDVIAVAQRHR